MDSTFFLTVFAAEIGFFKLFSAAMIFFKLLGALLFMVCRKFRDLASSSSSSSPPPSLCSSSSSSSLSSSSPPPSLCSSSSSASLSSSNLPSSSPPPSSSSCKWTHDVFPSFRGEDVRRNFLSHIQKEFRRKGITPFIDNDIKRGESIGPELVQAIRRSKVAVVLLSKNYASSKWCLDELVEIMKCKKKLGQTVFVIFYEVDPSHVKKLTGDFGAIFKKTCAGKTCEDIARWRQAFVEVATIAGYDSRNWVNEAVMIEEIVSEIFKRLFNSSPTRYFEGLIGMGTHMGKMERLLCLGSDEVRMIGIWGPPGIGKTTIARVTYDQVSSGFQLSVFMKMKPSYARSTSSDDYDEKLYLEQQFLSQLTNQKDLTISHLGAAQEFLMGKNVLIVFDGVEQFEQLFAMPEAQYFGPGTRIIITTQNMRVLDSFQIEHIYQMDLPPYNEALQMFCMSAFGQSYPKDGFEYLAREVTRLVGRLPLGLKVMGSHFRGILSKQEWESELPRLKVRLDHKIESILKFSYDALAKEDQDLFLYIACFFVEREGLNDGTFEDALMPKFPNVHQGLKVLVQRSLLTIDIYKYNYCSMHYSTYYSMHDLLVQLGREIIRKKSIDEPGKRQFLVDAKETYEVLTDNSGSKSVIGMYLYFCRLEEQDISERAFEELPNLQLLIFHDDVLHFPQGLKYLPPKLRILDWVHYPFKCLPSNFNPKFLVKIIMEESELEKLWEGIQPLGNLKLMNLRNSKRLKELPDLSTATNLQDLRPMGCSSLLKLPTSIENAKNLGRLDLYGCSSLGKLPSSIGNLTNLQKLDLGILELYGSGCSSLGKLPSSIGNLTNLQKLFLGRCSSLGKLPSSIGNLTNLQELLLGGCSSLVELPFSIGDLINLQKLDLLECSSLGKLPSSIGNLTNLQKLFLGRCSSLIELPFSIGNLINLQKLDLRQCSNLEKLPSSIKNLTNLQDLDIRKCSNLREVERPSSSENNINHEVGLRFSIGNLTNLQYFHLEECSSLVELPFFIGDLNNLKDLDLSKCSSLVELPSSIGNLINLPKLNLSGCSKLEVLPDNINLASLKFLSVNGCSQLRSFPEISTNIEELKLCGTLIEEVPLSVKSWSRLKYLQIPYCKNLGEFPNLLNVINVLELNNTDIEEFPPWFSGMSRLGNLQLNKCRKLVSLPQLPDSLLNLEAKNCESLERLAGSFPNSIHSLKFINCWKLNEETREKIIIFRSSWSKCNMLPGREVPELFTYRSTSGGSVKANLKTKRFQACISVVCKADKGARDEKLTEVYWSIVDKQSGLDTLQKRSRSIYPLLSEHLYTFPVEAFKPEPGEHLFEFELKDDNWEIAQCGIRPI